MSDKVTLIVSQDGTDTFEHQISVLLSILGYPEALVTDLATFLDMIDMFEFPTRELAQAELDKRLQEAGISLHIDVQTTLVEACRLLVADNPNWPGTPTVQ